MIETGKDNTHAHAHRVSVHQVPQGPQRKSQKRTLIKRCGQLIQNFILYRMELDLRTILIKKKTLSNQYEAVWIEFLHSQQNTSRPQPTHWAWAGYRSFQLI